MHLCIGRRCSARRVMRSESRAPLLVLPNRMRDVYHHPVLRNYFSFRDAHTDTHREIERDRDRDRETDRETERQTERQRDRQRDRQRERERERERQRDRERERIYTRTHSHRDVYTGLQIIYYDKVQTFYCVFLTFHIMHKTIDLVFRLYIYFFSNVYLPEVDASVRQLFWQSTVVTVVKRCTI